VTLYDDALAEVRAVASTWSRTLASFARHGHPNDVMPQWTRYLPGRTCLLVDADPRAAIDLDAASQVRWGDRDDPPGGAQESRRAATS
jgi:hypothetical protein